jgi:ATP-dependent Clp protease ATP-binding subunit ClpB
LLAKEGFDPQFGARPLKRLIVHSVENVLSKKIVNGEVKAGDSVEIYVNNGIIDVK